MATPEASGSSDKLFVANLRDGSVAAFEVLFNRYNKKLYRFSFKYLGNKEDAEEVVQNVFYKIWSNRTQLKPELSFNAYVIQIAKSIIYKIAIARKMNLKYYEYLQARQKDYHTETEESLQMAELEDRLHAGINNLPPQRKQIFVMSRFDGLSLDEIADKTNISKKTVKNHLTQAFHDLRNYLEKYELLGFLLCISIS